MDICRLDVSDAVPYTLYGLLVGQFVENTVTSYNNEVMVVGNSERLDLWSCDDHIRVPTALLNFSVYVSKCAAD